MAPSVVSERYEIKELLGEGGMGLVYRALDTKTKSDVALKTLRDASDPVAVEMFTKEWSILAGLSHPNIVDIRDVGEIKDNGMKKPYFVMPLLPGTTLARLIDGSSPRLSVERVVGIMLQVCRGLQAAHERGLIHRDIKPSNIFVLEDDTAKIIDFGIVHFAGTHSVTGHKGTWQYMAPEQVNLKPASPISDLFSVGVVCYEALTGKRPFARPTAAETAEAVRKHIPAPASEFNHAVSELMSKVIHKTMAKEPIHRFASARDLADNLQKALLNQPIERFDPARIQPRIERAKKAFSDGDSALAAEIVAGLEAEGNIGLEITLLRGQIEQRGRQQRIRHLLEGARTRMEQDEIPLALEKIQEILETDPDCADALALRSTIEKQRNQRQIESWLDLARKHLDRHDFSEARQALREVLRVRPGDTEAGSLLSETDRREQQSLRIRNEREHLYGSAMQAYQSGEITAALSKLKRVLELGIEAPDAAVPDRDAIYQSFYNRVRTERDSIQSAYESARRHLAEKAFPRALEICDELSQKYPNDALFQALRLEVVEQQRQEQSAYIADVGRRADAEADLDRKVSILKEACDRYPGEAQFQQTLKLTRDRRDLVNAIVAKARQYEERNQFTEAISQWDILRNIYPRFPGIELEVEQLSKRKEAQGKEESRARLVETIDRALESGDFARALALASTVLGESPRDPEFLAIERRAREGLERTSEAQRLLATAQQLIEQGRFEEAGNLLRQALACDPKSLVIRDALLHALAQQAQPLVESDWRKAEPLVEEACTLDAGHPEARRLRGLLTDSKRKEFVPQCLAEARELQANGRSEEGLERVEEALKLYPNDARLEQFKATLQNSIRGVHEKEARGKDYQELLVLRQQADRTSAVDEWQSILEKSLSIRSKHPDDAEITAVVTAIEHLSSASQVSIAKPEAGVPKSAETAGGNIPVPRPNWKARVQSSLDRLGHSLRGRGQTARSADKVPGVVAQRTSAVAVHPTVGGIVRWWPLLAVVLLAAAAGPWVLSRVRKPPAPPSAPVLAVRIEPDPPDSKVTVDGKEQSGTITLDPRRSYMVEGSRLGYNTFSKLLKPEASWVVKLEPATLHIRLSTSAKTGEVFVDDRDVGPLTDGRLDDAQVELSNSGKHTLTVKDPKKDILSFDFVTEPGKAPTIDHVNTAGVQVVTSLGSSASLYNTQDALTAGLKEQPKQNIPPEGLKLDLSADNHEVVFGGKDLPSISVAMENFPVLYAGLDPKPLGTMRIPCAIPGEQLWLNGTPVACNREKIWWITLQPGIYAIKIQAPGYETLQDNITLVKGDNSPSKIQLKALPTTATLKIEGGTSGAEVLIDGERKGQLDASGSATINDVVPGTHRVVIAKPGFERFSAEYQFTAGKTESIVAGPVNLKQFGTVSFEISPPGATITFREVRTGVEETVKAGSKMDRLPGRYHWEARLQGYTTQAGNIDIDAGKTAPVTANLVPLAVVAEPKKGDDTTHKPEPVTGVAVFANPSQIIDLDGELKLKTSGYALLKSGINSVTFVFGTPHNKLLLLHNKIVFVANYIDNKNRVEFEWEETKLIRKVYKNGVEDPSLSQTNNHKKAEQYEIRVEASGNQVVVLEGGAEVDRVTTEGATRGRIGLKGNSYLFRVEAR